MIVTIISLLAIIVGLSLIFLTLQKIVGIVLITAGVILSIVVLFGKNKNQNISYLSKEIINIQKEIEILQTKKEEINTNIDNFIKKYYIQENSNKIIDLTNLKTEYSKYKTLQNNKYSKELSMQKAETKLQTLTREIENHLSDYFTSFEKSYSELIQDLKIHISEFEKTSLQLEEAKKEKEKYEKENNIEEFENIEEVNVSEDETKLKIDKCNKQIDGLVDEKNQIKNYIEILENKIDENEFLESDIEILKEEINKFEEKYKVLKTTEELLKEAKESFSSSYLKDMILGFNKYLSIVDSKELKTAVDTNLDVKIEVNGSQKEIKTFSAGYKDLIYICIRFGLIDALYKDEAPFVVLDDPFVNLDESKTAKALQILNEFAKKYQLIYFSCNSSRI